MAQSIVVAGFSIESEAYQAFSEVKANPREEGAYSVIQGVIVKKEEGRIVYKDEFDTGAESQNDIVKGGVIGALIGLLGGPVGVLVGGGIGLFIGSGADSHDVKENKSMIERVSETLGEGTINFIALINEKEKGSFDNVFANYAASVVRFPADEIMTEVRKAEELERQQQPELPQS